MARASVIVDSFNYGRFLAESIESALAQTFPDTEVVVVDDGSTDDSREVIAGYGERVIPVLKQNGGQGSALNAGFAASSGEVVIFVDADDVLLPGAVEAVVPRFEDPEVAKVHWSMPVIDGDGRRTGEIRHPELPGGDFREHLGRVGPLSDETLPSAPTSGNAWSRRFLERVMPIPQEASLRAGDTYLLALAPAFGRLVVLEEPQSLFRVHGANVHTQLSFAECLGHEWLSLEAACRVAAGWYRQAGIEVDLREWARHPWWGRVHDSVAAIVESVSEGELFLLADEEMWGTEEDFFGRRRAPFPELDGEWGGIPADDAAAIAEVERWRRKGAVAIFFAWPAHWWLDHLRGLSKHLDERYRCLRRDELLVGYDLLR